MKKLIKKILLESGGDKDDVYGWFVDNDPANANQAYLMVDSVIRELNEK